MQSPNTITHLSDTPAIIDEARTVHLAVYRDCRLIGYVSHLIHFTKQIEVRPDDTYELCVFHDQTPPPTITPGAESERIKPTPIPDKG